MKNYTTQNLKDNTSKKGIKFNRGEKEKFNEYDYFQVINAYKPLFVTKVEKIDDIENNVNNKITDAINRYKKYFNIHNYADENDLLIKIYDKIADKYGLNIVGKTILEKKKMIKSINYIHHVYSKDAYYGDFVRMYEFEHELRNLLLKNVLIIEENIKRVFISSLNDFQSDSNYLTNINNYNTSTKKDQALNSLKKVIELHSNKNSKPIMRKRNQDIIIPYWILINEMTLGQTLTTIKNLKEDIKFKIFQRCLNEFTILKIDMFKAGISKKDKDDYRKLIETFIEILTYVGDFRNTLAHNQPIFCFNVRDYNLSNYPNVTFLKPKKPDSSKLSKVAYQYFKNESVMQKLEKFFGTDFFTRRRNNINLDLSWIIYVIGRIVFNIKDNNNNFGDDIRNIFRKFNILNISSKKTISSIDKIEILKDAVKNLKYNNIDIDDYIEKIDNGKSYKRKLKSELNENNKSYKKILKLIDEIKVEFEDSTYEIFKFANEYKKYTNIDSNFVNNI